MSAVALLAELQAAGIRICRDGDDLLAEIPSSGDLAPFRERIQAQKPALLAILAGEDQVAAAALEWRHVYRGPVDPTVPPPDWGGTFCPECRWPKLCLVLGPRGPHLLGGPCPEWSSTINPTDQ